ncbi:TPA: hypothetical protein R8H58_004462 [Escherichia coli]|nr:hypothetical protein [Escherichia coli]
MSEHKEAVSLGEIIRYMASQALKSEDKVCTVPVTMIARQYFGMSRETFVSLSGEEVLPGGEYHMPKLKASYVSNTVSRMPEIKAADVRSRFSLSFTDFEGESETYCASLSLVPGAVKSGSRSKAEQEREAATIERFKARLLKLSPSVAGLEGDELKGAVSMINAYQEMIKETK